MLGGVVFVGGLLAGCSEAAAADTFVTGLRANGIVGGERLDDGRLIMPHRAVRVTATDVTSSLDERLARDLKVEDGGLDAADDQGGCPDCEAQSVDRRPLHVLRATHDGEAADHPGLNLDWGDPDGVDQVGLVNPI